MKTSSDFLWRLIQSLSTAEKLFFKRNFTVSATGDQHLYLKVFDALSRQKKYDEPALLSKFAPVLNRKNIAFTKHYLQTQVSEAIVHYDCRNSIAQKIFKQIQLIRLYRQKGMPEEAHAIWKKAVFLARKNEAFGLLGLLKNEFEKIILFSNHHTSYDDLHKIFENRLISYNEYSQMMVLRDLYTETILLKRNAHFDLDDKLEKRIKELLNIVNDIGDKQYGTSFWFRHYFRMNKGTLLYLLNQMDEALQLFKESWKDWKAFPQFLDGEGEFYIELMYMINYAGIIQHDYDYVEDVFNDKVNEQLTEPGQRANFEVVKYLALNKIYNKTARYKKVEQLIATMKSKFKQWEPVLTDDLNITVLGSLGIGCFVLEQYSDALYFMKKAISIAREGTREDLVSTIQLLLLLTSYSMNNSKLFDSQYRTTYAYFYKQKKKHSFESALVHCLNRTFYMKDNQSKIKEYGATMEIFAAHKNENVQQMAFNIFNFDGWLKSRIQRIPYRKFVENKVKEENLVIA